VDFFEHKVRIAALLDGIHGLGNLLEWTLDRGAVRYAVQLNALRRQAEDLAIVNTHHPAGEGQDGGQVGRDAGEAIGNPGDQPGAFLDGVQRVFANPTDDEGVITFQILVSQANGIDKAIAALDIALNGVDTGLSVVGRADGHTLRDKLLA
jgi:hypothetical protein